MPCPSPRRGAIEVPLCLQPCRAPEPPAGRPAAAAPGAAVAAFGAVDCQLHEVLQAPEAAIMQVYFPETIGVSRLASMINGDVVEVGQVGHEGMVGLPVVLATTSTTWSR